MPRLRGIVSPLLGYEWIDVDAATSRGIMVANGNVSENRVGMAEATIMLLLALLYRLHETEALLWDGGQSAPLERNLLQSRTVGIIGYGGISKAVIARLAGWGCPILVNSRSVSGPAPGVTFVTLDELLQRSDAILVLTRLDASTRHLLGEAEFAKMRSGALLVNTSRGAIIDETALIAALRSGRVGAAALDVFEHEPLDPDHPLRDLPNVILTPHAIGHNLQAREALPRAAVANLLSILEGRVPEGKLNSASTIVRP